MRSLRYLFGFAVVGVTRLLGASLLGAVRPPAHYVRMTAHRQKRRDYRSDCVYTVPGCDRPEHSIDIAAIAIAAPVGTVGEMRCGCVFGVGCKPEQWD